MGQSGILSPHNIADKRDHGVAPLWCGGTQYGVLAAWREPDLGRVIAANICFYG